MSVPLVKIYNAIKDDYSNVKLEQGHIDIILNKDCGFELTIFDSEMQLYIGMDFICLSYSDEDDLNEIQNDISNTIVFCTKLVEAISSLLIKRGK